MRGVWPSLSTTGNGDVKSWRVWCRDPKALGDFVVFILGNHAGQSVGRIRRWNPGRTSHARRPATSGLVSFFLSTHWLASVEVLVGGSPAFFAFVGKNPMNRDFHLGSLSVPFFTTSMRASYCGGICHSGTSSKCGLIATYSKVIVSYRSSHRITTHFAITFITSAVWLLSSSSDTRNEPRRRTSRSWTTAPASLLGCVWFVIDFWCCGPRSRRGARARRSLENLKKYPHG
jgi:hypothetical protein